MASSWTLSNSFPNTGSSVTTVGTNSTGSIVYVSTAYKKLQRSTDSGATWSTVTSSNTGSFVDGFLISDDGQTVFVVDTNSSSGNTTILKSSDGGDTWSTIVSYGGGNISCISSIWGSRDLTTLYYTYQGSGVYKSVNGGANWTHIKSSAHAWRTVSCSSDGSVVAAVVGYGTTVPVYISTNGGTTWGEYGTAANFNSVYVSGNGAFIYAAPTSGSLLKFQNNGGVISLAATTTMPEVLDVVTSDDANIVFTLTSDGSVYKSVDQGVSYVSESVASGVVGARSSILAASRIADKAYFGGGVMVSYPNFAPKFYSYSGVGSDVSAPTAPCFLADARVQTPSGPVAIADIKEGDLILSAAGKPVSVRRVVTKTVKPTIQNVPYIIPAGTWGAQVDLPISPDHRVVVPQRGLVKASKLNLDRLIMNKPFTYYNLEVENCDNIVVEGVAVESLAHAKQYRLTMTEFTTLCKDLARRGKTDTLEKLLRAAQQKGVDVHIPLYVQRA